MAGEDLINYAGQASIAYQDALNQARNAQNALLRQYGFVAPTGTGEYSTEAAQAAFDPNMLFDKATGGIDKAKLDKALGGIMSGGGGLIGEALAAGTAGEAEAAMQERGRFAEGVTGGVSSQRRQLAESLAREQVGGVKGQFVSQIGEALAPIGGAFQNLQIAEAQTAYLDQLANAAKAALPTEAPIYDTSLDDAQKEQIKANSKPSALDKIFSSGGVLPATSRGAYNTPWKKTENTPKNPKPGQAFITGAGDRIIYREAGPKGAGWYKKG